MISKLKKLKSLSEKLVQIPVTNSWTVFSLKE
jgi:hypothetical protein